MCVFLWFVFDLYYYEFIIELFLLGIDDFDVLFGGGIEWGSIMFVSGLSGVGKFIIGVVFVWVIVECGECVVVYLFEESKWSF